MRSSVRIACAAGIVIGLSAAPVFSHPGPFDGKTFKGRIAYSADGNHNDEDDWAASPVALAIFAEFEVRDQVVHFDYNCILPKTDAEWEETHETSVLGAAERYGYDRSVFHDCQEDLDGAIDSIKQAVNASSAEDPLYFIVAGPMEVPYLGIQKADPEKRKFVYCISHSRWNDGFARDYSFTHTKRSIIPLGIKWVQIRDQNGLLSTSRYGRAARPDEWRPWHWMRDSDDSKVTFLWERMRVTTRADCSDAGMAYFLMTGDEEGNPSKLTNLLDDNIVPTPVGPRRHVRIEAESFLSFDELKLEYRHDRRASHRVNVKLASITTGRIRTRFDEPYTQPSGRYDVDVRYFDEKDGHCQFALFVNGVQQGESWLASADDEQWRTKSIENVVVKTGDEIMVQVRGDSGEYGKLDYVQFNYQGPASGSANSVTPVGALPEQNELPDPFLRPDGTRVRTLQEWREQREYLKAMLAHYMYGHMPPAPDHNQVAIQQTLSNTVLDECAVEEHYTLTITRRGLSVDLRMALFRPAQKKRYPTIIKNCRTLFDPQTAADRYKLTAERDLQAASESVRRGYLLCKFRREDLARDQKDSRDGGIFPLYPEYDWGAIAVWAWAHQVVLDVLDELGYANMDQVICTGHSRGGQTAMAAGIFDERIDIVVPCTGGFGSCGTLRIRDPDGVRGRIDYIDHLKRHVPHWFGERYHEFAGQRNKLPFDAHTLVALIAPRPLLNTNATDDEYNNTLSMEAGIRVGKLVFDWMQAEDRCRLHWRPGKHGQLEDDWRALLDFADELLFGKMGTSKFNKWVYPEFAPSVPWSVPKPIGDPSAR